MTWFDESGECVLVSLARSDPPSGGEGSDWFCYEIAQGSNTIVGYRRGDLETVKQDVEAIILAVNERRSGRRTLGVAPRR